jgi:hypothetical protein
LSVPQGINLGILKKPLLGDNQLEIIMENGMMTQGEGTDPSGFLSEIIGSSVTIKLNSGVVYKGGCYALRSQSTELM